MKSDLTRSFTKLLTNGMNFTDCIGITLFTHTRPITDPLSVTTNTEVGVFIGFRAEF